MTAPQHKVHRTRTRMGRLVAMSLAFSVSIGVAWAFWYPGSVTGGNGASAATTVNQGAKPTVVATGSTVAVSWAASTLSSGGSVAGYVVKRYQASTLALQTILAACNGTISTTSCTEANVPAGLWVYSVTPVLGTNWRGAESPKSDPATVSSCVGCPSLGSVATYSVLAVTAVTNSGQTTVSGDLGLSPSGTLTGFPPGIVAGATHMNDSAAASAHADLVTAYNDAAGRAPTGYFAGDNNGRTYTAGVYHTDAAFALTGTMTLDAQDNPNAVFIFQVNAALNTAAASSMNLINGAQASHVFWQAAGAVGTGANSSFSGTIMSAGAITLGDSSTLIGRALSYGTVTMSANTVRFSTALPPTITINGGATVVTKNPTPTITGTTSAAAGTAITVQVSSQVLTTTAQSNGTWSVTTAILADGSHTVVASVRDAAGNAGAASQALTVEINPTPVSVGTLSTYSVLASTGVTNAGPTNLSGDLGLSTSGLIAGFPPGVAAGTTHDNDAAAATAHSDLVTAYNDAAGRAPRSNIAGDLAGLTFHAGVYRAAGAISQSGILTLDGENQQNPVFIFQVNAAMATAAGSSINLINGATAANVFWQVAGAASTGANASFSGTIMAQGDIALGADTLVMGRVLSYGIVALSTTTARFTTALPPTVTVTGGAAAITKNTTPTITGTTNAVAGTTVTVKVAGQVLTSAVQAGGTWSVTATALAAGTYNLVASVRDAAGNAGAASQALTVEVNPATVNLGTASTYSVLAKTGVTNAGFTNLSGDLGLSTSGFITGFPPGIAAGATHDKDTAAGTAQTDLALAYNDAAGRTPTGTISGDLTLHAPFHAGVYRAAAATTQSGAITLDGENNPNAVFIFQINAAMTTAASSTVILTNGAQASNVFWQVLGAASTGAGASFAGTIMAQGAIALGANTLLIGRALSYDTVALSTTTARFTTALPPTVTITGGATAIVKSATATIAGTTNSVAGTTVTVRVAGQVLTTTVQSGGTWSVTVTGLADGAYTVVASARDAAGNSGAASQALTVEINPAPVNLGAVGTYSALAVASVANTGVTTLAGDLGVSPAGTISGFGGAPGGTVGGTTHLNDTASASAKAAMVSAYNDAAGRTPRSSIAGDLGGTTFHAGVYHAAAAISLAGTLTLDGQGDPNAVFIFQIDAAMATAAASNITLTNGALAANVFWQVNGAVTPGALSFFSGTILSTGAITFGAGARLFGRALAYGAVGFSTNTVTFN